MFDGMHQSLVYLIINGVTLLMVVSMSHAFSSFKKNSSFYLVCQILSYKTQFGKSIR